jgi:hypothetical protein
MAERIKNAAAQANDVNWGKNTEKEQTQSAEQQKNQPTEQQPKAEKTKKHLGLKIATCLLIWLAASHGLKNVDVSQQSQPVQTAYHYFMTGTNVVQDGIEKGVDLVVSKVSSLNEKLSQKQEKQNEQAPYTKTETTDEQGNTTVQENFSYSIYRLTKQKNQDGGLDYSCYLDKECTQQMTGHLSAEDLSQVDSYSPSLKDTIIGSLIQEDIQRQMRDEANGASSEQIELSSEQVEISSEQMRTRLSSMTKEEWEQKKAEEQRAQEANKIVMNTKFNSNGK